jgi:gentisate 1,2-dioxygenase
MALALSDQYKVAINPVATGFALDGGGWTMPTMGAHLALLPKGFRGED